MAREQKAKRVYNETYVKGTYVPDKKELISLIKKDKVSVYIAERSKYSDGSEEMKVVIKHN